MNTKLFVAGSVALMWTALVSGQSVQAVGGVTTPSVAGAGQQVGPNTPIPNAESPATIQDTSSQRALIDEYCVGCHNAQLNTANLLLDELDLPNLRDHAETGERIVRKLRAGMMPPTGMRRPDPDALQSLILWMENELDRSALAHLPQPGLHRLNRTEYSNAIRDLLGLRVDAAAFLPSDDSSYGFDNMAGTLTMSPALLEAYLSAAGKISRLAIGSVTAPTQVVFDVPTDTAQDYHIEGLPFGTRGGMLITHEFPASGDYIFTVKGVTGYFTRVLGQIEDEQLEVTLDGERVYLYDWDEEIGNMEGTGGRTPSIPISAGLHTIGVTFLVTNDIPGTELNKPFLRTMISPGEIPGFMFYPHVGQVFLEGPYNATPALDTPSRRKLFVCRPDTPGEEGACARTIISNLVKGAFRRPPTDADLELLTDFYLMGRNEGGNFDSGIEAALQRILADPEFVYRGEREPSAMAEGTGYRLSDLELASRLSFFLWSSIPDNELIDLAAEDRLGDREVLSGQVLRMIRDPRSEALVENFIGQWLNVRGMAASEPVVNLFPDFDSNLREAFRRETELFFDSIVREDRSILDLLTADYTFVNERLARHYGIPYVYGSQFRRVALGPELDMRRGLLGKGALMTVTSQAARTSPVTRGKWFLETFLGVSPPEPPPNVPQIEEPPVDSTGNQRAPTMREVMESHSVNPACASCHIIFEPLGLALENYDATGMWRTEDAGTPIDASGRFVDGTEIDGPGSLRELLTRYSDQYVRTVTEKLLTYALGRGVEYQDMPLVREIVRQAALTDYAFSSVILGIVRSPAFQMNMKTAGDIEQQAAR